MSSRLRPSPSFQSSRTAPRAVCDAGARLGPEAPSAGVSAFSPTAATSPRSIYSTFHSLQINGNVVSGRFDGASLVPKVFGGRLARARAQPQQRGPCDSLVLESPHSGCRVLRWTRLFRPAFSAGFLRVFTTTLVLCCPASLRGSRPRSSAEAFGPFWRAPAATSSPPAGGRFGGRVTSHYRFDVTLLLRAPIPIPPAPASGGRVVRIGFFRNAGRSRYFGTPFYPDL